MGLTERASSAGFKDSGYQLIYADPPWPYRDKANAGKRGAAHKYRVTGVDELSLLPIPDIAADDCLLAMWWVPPQPMEALQLMSAWGFTLKTMKGFTWVKRTKNGLRHFGMGHWTRGNTEDCLFAVRGNIRRINAGISQLIESQVREHSRKPDEVPQLLVDLMGPVKRIELFATRATNPAWDYWVMK